MFNIGIEGKEPTYNVDIDTKWAGTDNIKEHMGGIQWEKE